MSEMRSAWQEEESATIDVQTADAALLDAVVETQHDVTLRFRHLRHLRLGNDDVDEVVLV